MKQEATKWEIIRYRFDNFMARGGSSIFMSLTVVFILFLIFIYLLRLIIHFVAPGLLSERGDGFFFHLYVTFLQMTDPGNMAQDIESSSFYKITAILSGLSGIVFLSALIAFITTALDNKLNELKKGHSKVIEDDHTLIVGWDDQRILEILRELVEANESEDNPCVVILADKDKEEMDDFLKVYGGNCRNTKVITRSGHESSVVNLEVASVHTCKSIIILATCQENAANEKRIQSDSKIIKTILAILTTVEEDEELNITCEIFTPRYQKMAEEMSPGNVTVIEGSETLSKILVQTSRSVGLSVVYNEILSFYGCEMYFFHDKWKKQTFQQLSYHFPDGVPMGLRHGDGSLTVRPPADYMMKEDDEILILADDNDTILYLDEPVAKARDMKLETDERVDQRIERELIIGWTNKIDTILSEYSDYVMEGSEIDIIPRKITPEIEIKIKKLSEELPKLRLRLMEVDTYNAEELLPLEPFKYDNIIIISSAKGEGDEDRADSETIIQLLLLRKIFDECDQEEINTKLITEVLNSENLELVSRVGVNDFIISNRLISMLLAQVSESKDIKKVYDDLFSEDGSEIYLKPASLYLKNFPAKLSFADIMALANERDEICIGIKVKKLERSMEDNFGVKLIPEKNTIYEIQPEDSFVVVAEDET